MSTELTNESLNEPDVDHLTVELRPGSVPVSFLSSLLRVLQAALREVARSDEGTRGQFDQRPQPILVLSKLVADGELGLSLVFVNPVDSTPIGPLSDRTFVAFLDRFSEFVKGLPQPGLWGGAARRPAPGHFESELDRRLDQLYREVRRSTKATLMFKNRTIEIEGDRMEIG